MSSDVLDQLRESHITVTVRGKTLDFEPAPPEALKPALVREGQRLLRLHRKAAVALERVLDACGEDAELWLRLRDQLCNHWRDDVPQYKYFVSWVASHHMRANAYRLLNTRPRSTFAERSSWRGDIAVNDKLIAFLTPRLLNLALLNPPLHFEIITRKLPKRRIKTAKK
jgi:hypothetical protein